MNDSPARMVLALAAEGRTAEALQCLAEHVERGDPEALFVCGLWRIEGRHLPRDLPKARSDLTRSAAAGHAQSARILAGLTAAGVGAAPDWKGAVTQLERRAAEDPIAARQLSLIRRMKLGEQGDPIDVAVPGKLSDSPSVSLIPGLLAAEECDFLCDLAGQRFRPAMIFHEARRKFVKDPIRDSETASFPLVFEWPVVHALNRRIAAASATAVEQGEALQLLRYRPGQQYRPHFDAIKGMANPRELTVIVWLNEEYEGGETHFAATGLSVRGHKGDALMFRNCLPDGNPDPASGHSGLPVTKGEKLIASRWIRRRPPAGPDEQFGSHEAQRAMPGWTARAAPSRHGYG